MTTTMQLTVGELLKIARKRARLEQVDLATSLGIARNTVSNYETGRSFPAFDVVVRWAQLTDVSLEWLASGVLAGPRFDVGIEDETTRGPADYRPSLPAVHPPGLEPGTHWLTVARRCELALAA